jgi:hypothetical protein
MAGSLSVITVAPKFGLYTYMYVQCLMKRIGTVAICNLDSRSSILARSEEVSLSHLPFGVVCTYGYCVASRRRFCICFPRGHSCHGVWFESKKLQRNISVNVHLQQHKTHTWYRDIRADLGSHLLYTTVHVVVQRSSDVTKSLTYLHFQVYASRT